MESYLILASRRKGKKMWEGYTLVSSNDIKKEIEWRRDKCRICKVFNSFNEYRNDLNKKAV